MNRNKYCMAVMCMLLFSSNIAVAGPWSWIKDRATSMWLSYKRWNIPRPRLIEHQMMELGGKKFEGFRYDLSNDDDAVRMLRKKLHISGIYLANGSDVDAYKKYLQQIPMPEQYIQNGFDINLDNSISGCMERLFRQMGSQLIMFDTSPVEAAYNQIFWELEKTLPSDFDNDSSGQKFIDLITQTLPKKDETNKRDYVIGHYLNLWKDYSLRFKHNPGLIKAIKRYPQLKMFS